VSKTLNNFLQQNLLTGRKLFTEKQPAIS